MEERKEFRDEICLKLSAALDLTFAEGSMPFDVFDDLMFCNLVSASDWSNYCTLPGHAGVYLMLSLNLLVNMLL